METQLASLSAQRVARDFADGEASHMSLARLTELLARIGAARIDADAANPEIQETTRSMKFFLKRRVLDGHRRFETGGIHDPQR